MEIRSVEAIVGALHDAQVRYLIVGGLAVNAHGYERLTRDVDLVIQLQELNILNCLRALINIGYRLSIPATPEEFADHKTRQKWKEEKGMIVLKLWSDIHRRTPIDIFVYDPFDFDEEYASANWENVFGDIAAPVVSLKTLLKMKREAGRAQDLADIENLEEVDRLRQRKCSP